MLMWGFRCLVTACAEALEANEAAIGDDQVEYHNMLKNSFAAMMERLQMYFGNMVLFWFAIAVSILGLFEIMMADSLTYEFFDISLSWK